jgi:hypothetical protein
MAIQEDKKTSNKSCSHCKHKIETQDHFLSCNDIENEWRTQLLNAIDKVLHEHSHQTLKEILHWATINCRVTNHECAIATNNPKYLLHRNIPR